jgi:hypothetical protein
MLCDFIVPEQHCFGPLLGIVVAQGPDSNGGFHHYGHPAGSPSTGFHKKTCYSTGMQGTSLAVDR